MADSSVVGLLRVLLTADTAEFSAGMKRVSDDMKSWSKDLKSVGQQATQLGSALTKSLTLPIVAVGGAAVKAFIDFESSFAGVGKTVDGVVDKGGELTAFGKELAQEFRNLAKTIPVNVNELNKIGEAAGALGIPREHILEFTRTMAELGVTTNLTSDQAANAVARIQNIFGAAGQETDRLASTLVALGNAGASTESEIVEMAQRIAGAGHTVGLTQAQVLSFASTLASVGINAEAGGSAISRVFLKMNDAVQDGGDKLTEFARVAGMSAAEFKTAFEKDAAGATNAFVVGLGKLKGQGENVNGTLEGLIGKNIILKDTLLRLSGAGGLLADQLKLGDQAWKDNTALTEEAGKRFATVESQLTILWNRIKDVGITLGIALKPAIDLAISAISNLIPVIETIGKGFAALPTFVQLGIVAFAGLLAAAGPLIFLFGQVALSASAVTAAFATNGIAAGALGTTLSGLAVTLSILALKAAAVAAVGFAAWNVGKWIGETTGLTNAIEWLTGRLSGLTTEEILAGRAAREQAEAHKGQTTALTDAQRATKEHETAAKSMAVTQKAVEQAVSGATKTTKESEKATKAATKATEKHTAELQKLADIYTGKALAEEVQKFNDALLLSDKIGGQTVQQMAALSRQYAELERQGATLTPRQKELVRQYRELDLGTRTTTTATKLLTAELAKQSTVVWAHIPSVEAFNHRLWLTVGGSKEAQKALENLGGEVGKLKAPPVGPWEEWRRGASQQVDMLGGALADGFASMLTGAASFSDGFIGIWHSIQGAVTNILASVLEMFINDFIHGMIRAVIGSKGAFTGAITEMVSGAGSPTGAGGASIYAQLGSISGVAWATAFGVAALAVAVGWGIWALFRPGGLFGSAPRDSQQTPVGDYNPNDPNNPYYGKPDPGNPNPTRPNPEGPGFEDAPINRWDPIDGWVAANAPSFAKGGFGNFGAGTLAWLHGREMITPVDPSARWTEFGEGMGAAGSSSTTTVILKVDGRTLTRAVVPTWTDEVKHYGLDKV